jgi:hypothetical protein
MSPGQTAILLPVHGEIDIGIMSGHDISASEQKRFVLKPNPGNICTTIKNALSAFDRKIDFTPDVGIDDNWIQTRKLLG